jgi:putative transposase
MIDHQNKAATRKRSQQAVVKARSLFCYWAVRELGVSETELARRFEMTQAPVSIAVKRGETLANIKGWRLSEG